MNADDAALAAAELKGWKAAMAAINAASSHALERYEHQGGERFDGLTAAHRWITSITYFAVDYPEVAKANLFSCYPETIPGAGLLATTPPTQPAAEVVTEHAREMSGGGMHLRADYPEIENVYPLKDYIAHGQQHGGSVWRRQVVVVEDWTEVPPAADVKPGAETFQSPTENESPLLPWPVLKHKTEGGKCCSGKHMCGGPGSYCCSQTVYMHRHADGSTGPISTSLPPAGLGGGQTREVGEDA